MPDTSNSACRSARTKGLNRLALLAIALAVMLSAASASASASASDSDELIALINAYRESPQACDGKQTEAAGPLVPDARLARVQLASGVQLQVALQQVGYQPATVRVITLSGPGSVSAVSQAIQQRYCATLLDAQYAEVGVQRNANTWQVILARPLLPSGMPDWQAAGRDILQLVNAARAQPQRCGSQAFDPAPPLRWNERLGQSALAHSRDMAARNYFSHTGKDGSLAGKRATRDGYAWQQIGENIAAGQGSAKQTVAGWLGSPSHCFNIMNPDFSEMGAAYAVDPQSDAGIYWTQVFGLPR
ncbi:CAP domain-containing protein [Pseudomonas sp. 2FG]|uniref:CAP domain-containing protein n=1 Tax=Pseudomonas sp. 2FG TaxID=2502191 RepID=UPI0010F8AC60|nr:CAP domain-containing protein [Pseudomonas sp. 2FG]